MRARKKALGGPRELPGARRSGEGKQGTKGKQKVVSCSELACDNNDLKPRCTSHNFSLGLFGTGLPFVAS